MTSLAWLVGGGVVQADDAVRVRVADPYLELRSGAGDTFPIFYVAERGELVEILKRRTDWFKVRIERGKEGWVSREQMERTLTESGVQTTFRDVMLDDYLRRRFNVGVAYGNFKDDPVMIVRAGYQLSPHFALELSHAEAVGSFSTTELTQLNWMASPSGESRWVPYFALGVGIFTNTPKVSLIGARTTESTNGNVAIGLNFYLTRSFMIRGDYRRFLVPVDENRVNQYPEWSLGLGVFF
jgi:uncharacterized protein YgiM (DUF1202 family)